MIKRSKNDILSEYTKNMIPEQIEELQARVQSMTEKELLEFRSRMNADEMGFSGEECI